VAVSNALKGAAKDRQEASPQRVSKRLGAGTCEAQQLAARNQRDPQRIADQADSA
jgi:hypothetical protein